MLSLMLSNQKCYMMGMLLCLTLPFWAVSHVSFEDVSQWQVSNIAGYVGDTVIFEQPIYLCNNSSGTYAVSLRRIFAPNHIVSPGTADYEAYNRLNNVSTASLRNVTEYHRTGEKICNLQAVIHSAGDWEFLNGQWIGNKRSDLEAGIPTMQIDKRGKHRLLVCAMNVEYYLTDNITNDAFGPSSEEEHQDQRAKISAALAKINADIYGLAEVQQGQNALKEIAEDLTKNTGRNFTYIADNSTVNGSYTKVGYVYCSDVVTTHGMLRNNDTEFSNRKKIQAFKENSSGEVFFFSMNHFKAKSGTSGATGANADQGDGQGVYNATRVKEAESVMSQYYSLRRQYNENDILIMGDLNAYAMEDPITTFTESGMTDLHRFFYADSSYSYTYRGQAGYLDHALCNASILPQITGFYVYHINSDENSTNEYQYGRDLTMFRCSDHDPIVVGLSLGSSFSTSLPFEDVRDEAVSVAVSGNDIVVRNANIANDIAFFALFTADGRQMTVGDMHIDGDDYVISRPTDPGIYILIVNANNQTYSYKIRID